MGASANDLTNVTPFLTAMALEVLREFLVMPSLVNGDYGREAAEKGDLINVPIAPTIAVSDAEGSSTPSQAPNITPQKVAIPLDRWKKAEFTLTDKEILEITDDIMPATSRSAIVSLATQVNSDLLDLFLEVPSYGGDESVVPFSTGKITDASQARKRLNLGLAPLEDRRLVLDPEAAASALEVLSFSDASASNDPNVITNGFIGRKIGFDWREDQSVKTHIAGTFTGTGAVFEINGGSQVLGVKTLNISIVGTGTMTLDLTVGDKITIVGDSQVYHISADSLGNSDTSPLDVTINIEPGLKVVPADAAVITLKGSYVANLAFSKDAFAFANRPLRGSQASGATISVVTDPQTGITIRLEVERQTGQDLWRYDILYGVKTVRPELATIIGGLP